MESKVTRLRSVVINVTELMSSALYKEILNGFPPNVLAEDLKVKGESVERVEDL